jgi:hypothetical protein
MRSTRSKTLAISIIGAIALGGALSGCVAIPGVSCNFTVENSHKSSGSPQYMDGKARISCTGTVQSLTGEIKMQRKSGTSWVTVSGSPNSRTVTDPVSNKEYTLQTGSTKCVNGTYRTAARGSGIKDGVSSGSSDWEYSGAAAISC